MRTLKSEGEFMIVALFVFAILNSTTSSSEIPLFTKVFEQGPHEQQMDSAQSGQRLLRVRCEIYSDKVRLLREMKVKDRPELDLVSFRTEPSFIIGDFKAQFSAVRQELLSTANPLKPISELPKRRESYRFNDPGGLEASLLMRGIELQEGALWRLTLPQGPMTQNLVEFIDRLCALDLG